MTRKIFLIFKFNKVLFQKNNPKLINEGLPWFVVKKEGVCMRNLKVRYMWFYEFICFYIGITLCKKRMS